MADVNITTVEPIFFVPSQDPSLKREWKVTVKEMAMLDDFYNDMETEGGNLYIPNRAVDCFARRPISRTTHYMLTDEEALLVKQDERILDIRLNNTDLGVITEISGFSVAAANAWSNKSANPTNDKNINWGITRLLNGHVASWGTDNTAQVLVDIYSSLSGKNVDIVVVDGGMIPKNHPEYASNIDGSGGSRVIEYDWYQHNVALGGTYDGPYKYDGTLPAYSDHATMVASNLAGTRNGFAKDANIYVLSFAAALPSGITVFDYLREFHKNKPINPVTGRKNPTVTNHSYNSRFGTMYVDQINGFIYRGTTFGTPYGGAALSNTNCYSSKILCAPDFTNASVSYQDASQSADVADTVNEGIIVVISAGNQSWYTDTNSTISGKGIDYDNYFINKIGNSMFYNGANIDWGANYAWYYNRPASPAGWGNTEELLDIGAAGRLQVENKADFSMCGPGVSFYAPGEAIMGAINNIVDQTYGYFPIQDTRQGGSYYLTKYFGTSMAAPIVTGVISCIMEAYPHYKQADIRKLLMDMGEINPFSTYTDTYNLRKTTSRYDGQNTSARYARFRTLTRSSSDKVVYPRPTGLRPTSKQLWPRPKNYKK